MIEEMRDNPRIILSKDDLKNLIEDIDKSLEVVIKTSLEVDMFSSNLNATSYNNLAEVATSGENTIQSISNTFGEVLNKSLVALSDSISLLSDLESNIAEKITSGVDDTGGQYR